MAAAPQVLGDVISPVFFTEYSSLNTRVLSAFVQSGILEHSPVLDEFLVSNGGTTMNKPSWKDVDDDTPRVSTIAASPLYTAGFGTAFPAPSKIQAFNEIAVRLNRNNHWTSSNLLGQLAGEDPFSRIGDRVAAYWARHLQTTTLAILAGVFANDDTGTDANHTQGDLSFDVSGLAGGAFQAGLTNFTAEALFDAIQTAGDAKMQFTHIAVHSAVHNRMKKNNLIDFVQDSVTGVKLETFQDLILTVDDQMPNPGAGQVYHSYIFVPGALQFADSLSQRDVGTEVVHRPEAGNGGGADELWNRIQWCIHPMGHAYIGTSPDGGPDNTSSANMLAAAASWQRRAPQRKQIGLARLITREG